MSGTYPTLGGRAQHQEPQSRAEVNTTSHGFPAETLIACIGLLHQKCHTAHTDIKEVKCLAPSRCICIDTVREARVERVESYEGARWQYHLPLSQNGHAESLWRPGLCGFGSAVPTVRWARASRGDSTRRLPGPNKSFWISTPQTPTFSSLHRHRMCSAQILGRQRPRMDELLPTAGPYHSNDFPSQALHGL
jgi:hypothetical protein